MVAEDVTTTEEVLAVAVDSEAKEALDNAAEVSDQEKKVAELQDQTDVKADSDQEQKADRQTDQEEQKATDQQAVLLKLQKPEDQEEANIIC